MVVTFFFFLRLTCSGKLWGGRNTANKYHWHVLTVIQPHWVCPCSWHVCFLSLHCSDSRLLCRELSDAGPGLHALPRSKLLGFRFLGTKVQTWLGLRFAPVPGPSSSRDEVLGVQDRPQLKAAIYPLPVPAARFSGCTMGTPSQVCRVYLLGS